jgi:hypothetical protein
MDRGSALRSRLTDFGFDWGAAEVRRLASHKGHVAMAQHYSEDADMSDEMRPAVLKMNILGKKRERRLSTRATM